MSIYVRKNKDLPIKKDVSPMDLAEELEKEGEEEAKSKEEKKEVAMAETKTVQEDISMVEVPTQTTIAFKLSDGRVIDERALLMEMFKDIKTIKKAVA